MYFRRSKYCDGFTLIEMMVVVLIIGILIAIAIPMFSNAKTKPLHKATHSNLRLAVAVAVSLRDEGGYVSGVARYNSAEPEITFVDSDVPSTNHNTVSISLDGVTAFYAVAYSEGQVCWAIRHIIAVGSGGTSFSLLDAGDCTAENAINGGWVWNTNGWPSE